MIKELLALPPRLESMALIVAWLVAAAGIGLWLVGARFNRALMCLGGVSVGAVLGMHMPHWFGWSLDGWACALGFAAVLGILGFAMHRVGAGLALAGLLALWGGLLTWVKYHGSQSLQWPTWQSGMALSAYGKGMWNAFPVEVRNILPLSCSVAAVAGLAMAVFKPRLAMLLLHSAAGTTLMVLAGLAALKSTRPDSLHWLPRGNAAQAAILLGMVGLGMFWQWRLSPGRKPAAGRSSKKTPPRNRPTLE